MNLKVVFFIVLQCSCLGMPRSVSLCYLIAWVFYGQFCVLFSFPLCLSFALFMIKEFMVNLTSW